MTDSPRNPSGAAEPFQLHTVAGSLVEPELDLDRTSAIDTLDDESQFVRLNSLGQVEPMAPIE
jgi:hypothetical protein